MLSKKTKKYRLIARTIDEFMTIDLTGVGLIQNLSCLSQKVIRQ